MALTLDTKNDALRAILARKRTPNMSSIQVLQEVLTVAQRNGWADVIVQVQLARTRDQESALTAKLQPGL